MYSAVTYEAMKSYLTRLWDKKIRNGYTTLLLLLLLLLLETRIVMW